MPIIGLKKDESEDKGEEVKRILKRLIHASRLVGTEYDKEVMESSKRDGVIQPLLVRNCLCKLIPEPHFEIWDGHSRHEGIDDPDVKLRCIIEDLTDEQVLEKMFALEHKGKKSTFWRAEVVAKRMQLMTKRLGSEEGARTEVAKRLGITLSLVSQYLRVYELYCKLQIKDQTSQFSAYTRALKSLGWGVNRLYELAKLVDYNGRRRLLEKGIDKALENPNMKLSVVKEMVKAILTGQNEDKGRVKVPRHMNWELKGVGLRTTFEYDPNTVDELKRALYVLEPELTPKGVSEQETLRNVIKSLSKYGIDEFIKNPSAFGMSFDRDKKGRLVLKELHKISENNDQRENQQKPEK